MIKSLCFVVVACTLLLVGATIGSADGYHGGGYHGGGGYYRGGWGGPAFRGTVWINPGWGSWGVPIYPYYAPQPQVIIQQPTPLYLEPQRSQPEEEGYWYYCPNPAGYYPYIKKCPAGWLKVVPTPAPSDPKE